MKNATNALNKYAKYTFAALIATIATLMIGCSSAENIDYANRECRADDHLGSRISKRICMTKEQWAVVDEREERLRQENADETRQGLRQADIMGSHVPGRSFDNPAGLSAF